MQMIKSSFLEVETNHLGSKFIEEHYNEILNKLKVYGDDIKREDMLHDCYCSMLKKENNGCGFDAEKGELKDSEITVAQYVYGTLAKYAKNVIYKNSVVQKMGSKAYTSFVIAASADSNSSEERDSYSSLNKFERAYIMAECSADYESFEEVQSIREQLEYCIGFDEITGCNIKMLLLNLDKIMSSNTGAGLFDTMKKQLEFHDEFRDAFTSVLNFRQANREQFDAILCQI